VTALLRLSAVRGQEGLVRLLCRLVARQRLPHTVLLEGPAGCGRRTLARALAAALLCQSPRDGDACTVCPSCVQCAQDTHPDIFALPHDSDEADADLDKAKEAREQLKAEQVRDMIEGKAWESPLLGGKKIFLLYSVERLHGAAANALLKVLEEPPTDTVLILTTEYAGGILPTIRSRVQLYRMQPLSADAVAAILVAGGVAPSDAHRRAPLANGSHRGLFRGETLTAPIEQLMSLVGGGYSAKVVTELASLLPQRSEDGKSPLAEQRRICRHWLIALQHHLRGQLTTATALRAAEQLERIYVGLRDLQRNQSPRLVLEGLALARV